MKQFLSVHDLPDLAQAVHEALQLKATPWAYEHLGKHKTLGLVFLNPSLRTRLSTQKAAMQLGMQVLVMNANQDAWTWETGEGAVMDGSTIEHIKDAAQVLSQYCDVVGIRCFPKLQDRDEDYEEQVLKQFVRYCRVPVISLESATLHPLQSFADLITIYEHWLHAHPPTVVLTWAPHIKPLPQAVANSFAQWMLRAGVDFRIAYPEGYALKEEFVRGAKIYHHQAAALEGADFVYVKNWSAYTDYGAMPPVAGDWLLKEDFLKQQPQAKVMHCLPVRRNVEISDAVLDSPQSLIYAQAHNRTLAAQVVLKRILEHNEP